jgi:hypothetical protein
VVLNGPKSRVELWWRPSCQIGNLNEYRVCRTTIAHVANVRNIATTFANITSNATGDHLLAHVAGAKMAGRMGPTLPSPLFMGTGIRAQYQHTLFL